MLLSQMTRLKTSLAEELIAARKELERCGEVSVRAARDREELSHAGAAQAVLLAAAQREALDMTAAIASLRSDKDALESALYDAQQLNAQLDTRKEQLEGENQELILKKENLHGE